jgi:hypothetical protein
VAQDSRHRDGVSHADKYQGMPTGHSATSATWSSHQRTARPGAPMLVDDLFVGETANPAALSSCSSFAVFLAHRTWALRIVRHARVCHELQRRPRTAIAVIIASLSALYASLPSARVGAAACPGALSSEPSAIREYRTDELKRAA